MPTSLRVLHIATGLAALGAGAVALWASKGARLHRRSGMVFVVTMLVMSGTGALMAGLKVERPSIVGGLMTFYLVTTALLTVRRPDPERRWLDPAAMLLGLLVSLFAIGVGLEAARSPGGQLDGIPAAPNFIFGTVGLLAVAGDARRLARGIHGARRIARHLWRMCFALFAAAGSFFLGQPQVFPEPIRESGLLPVPVLLVLLLMLYWLVRLRFGRRQGATYETSREPA